VGIPCVSLLPSFFKSPAIPLIYTLSLHDALPICLPRCASDRRDAACRGGSGRRESRRAGASAGVWQSGRSNRVSTRLQSLFPQRSEEHTSELQSHLNLVCRLLLEKKKENGYNNSE